MKNIKIPYNPDKLTSFDREWLIHKKCKEWWYATGILFDDEKNMYSYQYTLLHINLGLVTAKVAMMAMTDYKNKRHYYLQTPAGKNAPVVVTEKEASIGNIASAKKTAKGICIMLSHKDFSLDIMAGYGKGAFWHCNDGKLQMGIPGEKETTLYYSYTNMPTEGTLILNGKRIHLTGKTWFDKQGGTYSIANHQTHWEWFSLRFFDDEEVMLFTFPQNKPAYYDGTFISRDGTRHRLNDYVIKTTETTTFGGMRWSSRWELQMKEKDQYYTLEPVQEGHINFVYFEELCYIKNRQGEIVGYAFAELLPGVLNDKLMFSGNEGQQKVSLLNLFKRIEF